MSSGAASFDAVVVGSGPNGLAAAITLAAAGASVLVVEAHEHIGGGTRTAELTRPGFAHDVCSAVHPLAATSPFFRDLPLAALGAELVHPAIPLAHPIDGGRAGVLHRSLDDTVAALGVDGARWRSTIGPLVDRWERIGDQLLGPLSRPPRHPLAMARFGLPAVRSAEHLARRFDDPATRGMVAGLAGHSFLPLTAPLTASFGLMLAALAHTAGWPFVAGGSQRLADALGAHLRSLGGEIRTGWRVESLADLPAHRVALLDTSPDQVLSLTDGAAGRRVTRRVQGFRHGPGVCKVDFALSAPVPWTAPECGQAGTVHVGGTFDEIRDAEADVVAGRHPERPYVLSAQPGVVDPSRAPAGQHTLWAYCHVPNGSDVDMADRIAAQIERFAPGFGDVVLDRHIMRATDMAAYNPTYVGGDIAAGAHGGLQLLARPWPSLHPYRTGVPGVFLCSASTPPGAGVHGMCGRHAAHDALGWLARHR